MRLLKPVTVIFACILLSCGIEETYYLPQLSDGNINRTLNTEAVITIPPISEQYYYASYYSIFYRIYASDHNTLAGITQTYMPNISSSLAADYNALFSFIDPTNTTSIASASTFKNRNYFEIELDEVNIKSKLSTKGGTLRILFPNITGDYPVAIFNDEPEIRLIRSSQLIPKPDDPYFRNTQELRNNANANSNVNTDVAGRSAVSQYSYVSMYIVATGTNPTNFTQIFSKPTHISVFRLPDAN
jgi:hypothetical protein